LAGASLHLPSEQKMKAHRPDKPDFKHTFQGMYAGTILGILDSSGAVESYFIPINDIWGFVHGDIFDFKGVFYRWRWWHGGGISTTEADFEYGNPMDADDMYKIQSHLTRMYGLKFDDMGCFDWRHFSDKMKEEEDNGIEDPYDD